jgi:hypothetical protein
MQTTDLAERQQSVSTGTDLFPGFCIVFDDDEVERDADGYFVKPDYLAGTHPRDYACGDDEIIIRLPGGSRDAR